MPTPSTFYYNSTVFCDATDIWTDNDLTTPAPDGWYQVGEVYRQKIGGVLGPCNACPSCGTGIEACNTSVTGSGSTGRFLLNYDVGSSVGAVVIKFQPLSQPDQCTWTHDGLTAREYSSRPYGYRQGIIGDETVGGAIGLSNLLGSNGATYTADLMIYNPTTMTFLLSGAPGSQTLGPYLPQATYPAVGGVDLTTGGYSVLGQAFMVVPKTDPTANIVELEIQAPGSTTYWSVIAYCPRPLNLFMYNPISGGVCGTLTKPFYTCSVEPGGDGTSTMLGLNDWAFKDYYGNEKVPAGIYPVEDGDGVTKCVTVADNGTITNISAACAGTC